MKRRAFISTLVSAAVAVVARRPVPARLPDWHGITFMTNPLFSGPLPDWTPLDYRELALAS